MPKVFFSYSHQDNSQPKDWVDQFHTELTNYVRVYSGKRNLVVWKDNINRDYKSERILDEVKQGLEDADVFVAVLSPSYLDGWWGGFEREYFLNYAFAKKNRDIAYRRNRMLNVIKLVLRPDDEKSILREFKTNYTYSFCRFRNGAAETIKPNDSQYEDIMVAIANSIAVKLRERPPMPSLKIFLAKASEDLLHYQMQLKSELEASGDVNVEIYSAGNFNESKEHYQSEVDEVLQQCSLAIHMFGEGSGTDESQLHWEIVTESIRRTARPIKVMSWIPPSCHKNIVNGQTPYSEFIVRSVMGMDLKFHDYLVRGFEDFMMAVTEQLKER